MMRPTITLACVLLAAALLQPAFLTAQEGASGSTVPRPGDQITITVLGDPEVSGAFAIDLDGYVVLPRMGRIAIAGRAMPQLREELRSWYVDYTRNPSVEISFLRRVAVLGAVRNPDLYMVDPTVTLRDVIAMAGGLQAEGDPGRLTLVRDMEQITFSRRDARFRTLELQSGDQIVVGERSWFERNSLAIVSTAAVVVSVLVSVVGSN